MILHTYASGKSLHCATLQAGLASFRIIITSQLYMETQSAYLVVFNVAIAIMFSYSVWRN